MWYHMKKLYYQLLQELFNVKFKQLHSGFYFPRKSELSKKYNQSEMFSSPIIKRHLNTISYYYEHLPLVPSILHLKLNTGNSCLSVYESTQPKSSLLLQIRIYIHSDTFNYCQVLHTTFAVSCKTNVMPW